ncbi:potassium transporter (Trk family) protein [marine actinobacterium PHSC20C1]|nr:potassium transporter (Trk family) protein [marine actinobacterium PHSC20C1]
MNLNTTHVSTIVVGAGQAGLATGFHLSRHDQDFLILDANERIGESWRRRWDSLRLFTPARHSGLPGLANPSPPGAYSSKDEVASYLEGYAAQLGLPVRSGVTVSALARGADGFTLATSDGTFTAENVVVATGANALPSLPSFASQLDAGIRQLHADDYQNPGSVEPGPVLVVGAGTSGAEIALEVAASRPTYLAGRPTAHIPDAIFTLAGGAYWAFVNGVLTLKTPMGRKVASKFHTRGSPLIRISMKQVEAAGVIRLPRLTGVEHGLPVADGATVPPPKTVVWATGYRPDLQWIPDLPRDEFGLPATRRGVVKDIPGLYFVGMPFQFALTSALIGGVGRDADYIARRIADSTAKIGQLPIRRAGAK